MDEVGQPFDSERLSLLAHDERDGVHEVGLAGSIGPDHGQERRQWTQFPETLVTLEVLQLDVAQLETENTGLVKGFSLLFHVAYSRLSSNQVKKDRQTFCCSSIVPARSLSVIDALNH